MCVCRPSENARCHVNDVVTAIIWLLALAGAVFVFAIGRPRRNSRMGPGTTGTVYDWLNEEKRNAIELIVEEKAAARDPEHRDGNLPDLERP
jgi:hypothetical protein